tara:strand:+ start:2283 stop:2429 length:147 start_codon:yes stop_codon:yes gene_type:complete
MFNPLRDGSARLPAIAQILYKARIANGHPSEPCPGHVGLIEEYLDLSQ